MSMRTVEMALATPGLDAEGKPRRVPLGVGRRHPGPASTTTRTSAPSTCWSTSGPQHPATHGVLRLVSSWKARCAAVHPARRLSPLGVREARRVPALQPDHSAHRPHRLPVADGEQRRLRARGRKVDGDRGDGAVQGAAGDRVRDEPHHLPPGLARDHRHRPRRVHAVPLVVPGAGADLQPPGGVDRRAAHHQPDPRRRDDGRRARRLGSRPPRIHPHLS